MINHRKAKLSLNWPWTNFKCLWGLNGAMFYILHNAPANCLLLENLRAVTKYVRKSPRVGLSIRLSVSVTMLYVLRVLKLKTFPFLNIRFLLIIYWYFKNSADSSRWNINCIFQIAYTFFKFLLTTAIFEILQNWTNFYLLKTDFVVKLLNYEMRYTLLDCVYISLCSF